VGLLPNYDVVTGFSGMAEGDALVLIGQTVGDALKTVQAFSEMVSSRGADPGDEHVLGDGIAFAGVSKYPARVKCALLGWLAFKTAAAEATASLCEEKR
jgi:nitrogen fixation NifU-like protein